MHHPDHFEKKMTFFWKSYSLYYYYYYYYYDYLITISIVSSNGKFVNKESMSKLHIKELRSCLSIMATDSKESLSVYSLLVMGNMKPNKYFEILYIGEPI